MVKGQFVTSSCTVNLTWAKLTYGTIGSVGAVPILKNRTHGN